MRRGNALQSPMLLVVTLVLAAGLVGTAVAGSAPGAGTSATAKQTARKALKLAKENKKAIESIQLTPGPTGDKGERGAPGPQGQQGAPGTARAYGLVSAAGGLSRSKNVASVTRVSTGNYCIALAGGIDPASSVLLLQANRSDAATDVGTEDVSVVEWNSTGGNCPAGTLQVFTDVYDGDGIDDDDGGGNTTGDDLTARNVGFVFAVP